MTHKYEVGDKVRITAESSYSNETVPVGSIGTVERTTHGDLVHVVGVFSSSLAFWRNEIEPYETEPIDKTALELDLLKKTLRQHGGGDLVKLVETTVSLLP